MTNAYQAAGVDVEAGYEVVERIKKHVKRTERLGVMGAIGSFGGCFDLSQLGVKEPVLVSGTDGVGTKLMLAIQADKHDTIGIDCVAMCVNDIIAQGAAPLYFLDYLATGKNYPEKIEQIVAGVAEGCAQSQMALIGGETAEMPGMYQENDYDLAGFAVGVAEKSQLLHPSNIQVGDRLIGLPSSGIHSNGYSLVRQILFKQHQFQLIDYLPTITTENLGELLLTPTRIYVSSVLPLVKKQLINGMAHITGGGFIENIPRMLPKELAAHITLGSWPILPIFKELARLGQLSEEELFGVFNMGIGMVLAVSPDRLSAVKQILEAQNESFYDIGVVTKRMTDAITFDGEAL